MRRDGKKLKRTVYKLNNKLGRRPTVEELSEKLGISKDRINALYYKLYSAHWVSLDKELGDGESTILDTIRDNSSIGPDKAMANKHIIKLLSQAIDRLKEKERLVISLYYYEGLTQVEIANVLELSEARISQLHKKAVYRLRGFLSQKKEQLV